jgi:hypothetical protein
LNCAGSVLFARFFSCLPLPRPLVQYRQGQRTGKPGGSRGTLGKSPRPHLTIVGSVAFARALRQSPSRPSSRCCAGCSPKRAALFCCFGGDAKGGP